jgi:hypothetical protein
LIIADNKRNNGARVLTLKTTLILKAVGAVFAAAAVGAAAKDTPYEAEEILRSAHAEVVCVSGAEIQRSESRGARYFSQLFEKAGIDVNAPGFTDNNFAACLDSKLGVRNAQGFFWDGYYEPGLNHMIVNPWRMLGDVRRITTVRHEMRHRAQWAAGVDPDKKINAPESERIVLDLAQEADARLEEVLFAVEQRQAGNNIYCADMKKSKNFSNAVNVYDRVLRKDPNNHVAAMQAVIHAFLQDEGLMQDYQSREAQYILKNKMAFNPYQPAERLLTDDALRALGERKGMENYMDETMMKVLRASFTQADYERMSVPSVAGLAPGLVH